MISFGSHAVKVNERFRKKSTTRPSTGTRLWSGKPDQTVPYGTGLSLYLFQALPAWLPSFGPYGTIQQGTILSAADRVYIARSYKDSAPTERSSSPLSQDPSLKVFSSEGDVKC
jgi:hypothetical protein